MNECLNRSLNEGLISEDRNNKITLLLTIPRFIIKSYAKDLTLDTFKYYYLTSSLHPV